MRQQGRRKEATKREKGFWFGSNCGLDFSSGGEATTYKGVHISGLRPSHQGVRSLLGF